MRAASHRPHRAPNHLVAARASPSPADASRTRAQFALSALAALPAWLSPFSRAGGALDDGADASLFFPDDADAFGDAGLAVWLAQRAQR